MKEYIKYIILAKGNDIERKTIFWNMLFSIMSAFQSTVMIMLTTRIDGAESAGILSIAYASAYLMYTVGTYGVRNFHATDSGKVYCYNDYKIVRFLSCGGMIVCSVVYCILKGYAGYKLRVILLVSLLKMEEIFEDLYHGELQRSGRLDVAGGLGALRLGISYIAFAVILLVTKDLINAILAVIFVSLVIVLITRKYTNDLCIGTEKKCNWHVITKLLVSCFPLFMMSFLSIYISNAPKYAIDTYLSERDQAYYAIISMPVFTINLLSGIVYRPRLFRMAQLWNANNTKGFKKFIWNQIRNILVISFIIIIGGGAIGVSLLEILYGLPLEAFKKEIIVLLIGGGVVAIYNFMFACLTIVRKQFLMLVISIVVMVIASVISDPIVQFSGLTGASYLYLILMIGEMISVSSILLVYLYKKK